MILFLQVQNTLDYKKLSRGSPPVLTNIFHYNACLDRRKLNVNNFHYYDTTVETVN